MYVWFEANYSVSNLGHLMCVCVLVLVYMIHTCFLYGVAKKLPFSLRRSGVYDEKCLWSTYTLGASDKLILIEVSLYIQFFGVCACLSSVLCCLEDASARKRTIPFQNNTRMTTGQILSVCGCIYLLVMWQGNNSSSLTSFLCRSDRASRVPFICVSPSLRPRTITHTLNEVYTRTQ